MASELARVRSLWAILPNVRIQSINQSIYQPIKRKTQSLVPPGNHQVNLVASDNSKGRIYMWCYLRGAYFIKSSDIYYVLREESIQTYYNNISLRMRKKIQTVCWKGQNQSISIFVVITKVLIMQRYYRVLMKGRERADKEDHHYSSLDHNSESIRCSTTIIHMMSPPFP